MATLLPTSQSTSVEAYEDMFKEITRKLYGDESAHGLYPHNTQVAQIASGTGPTIPEGERSFTTLVSDRSLAQLDYDNAVDTTFKTEDHLSTAFGLAALMQNGFPPPGAILNPVNFNMATSNKQTNIVANEEKWQPTEEIMAWNANKISNYTAPQKLFKVKTKQEPICTVSDTSVLNNNNNNNSTIMSIAQIKQPQSSASLQSLTNPVPKRYNCVSCPYSTDRRDLFTRHENIHKEEKPFHCYACLKQFNRADHVKKHFLRMHREMTYDINKTRRNPPKTNFYQSTNNQTNTQQQQQQQQQQLQPQHSTNQSNTQSQSTINIPTSFVNHSSGNTGQFTNNLQTNHVMEQQQQQQQQQQNLVLNGITNLNQITNLPNNIIIKQEKPEKSPKKRSEKRFMCCYCSWSGADNWGLKRHLNTHTKPFVCLLCDYKAARSERLATHVFKVHNKKACNKCSFFADDQNQLISHQIETHPNDQRPSVRQTNNQTITNNVTNGQTNGNQLVNTNANNNNSTNPNTNNNSGNNNVNISNSNTGNVLRTLQNAFVPNSATLNNVQNNFGSINSSVLTNSAIYTTNTATNNVTANSILNNLNHHLSASNANSWRLNPNSLISVTLAPSSNSTTSNVNVNMTTTSSSNSNNNNSNNHNNNHHHHHANNSGSGGGSGGGGQSTSQKHGAERLFAYLEADGSDPEDYNRQLAMQALSRNTASVAQDFHNAGGEEKPILTHQQSVLCAITNKLQMYEQKMLHRGIEATPPNQCSPPAISSPCDERGGRRQNNNNNNNVRIKITAPPSNVFDKLYQRSIENYIENVCRTEDGFIDGKLLEFLENNPEVSITSIKKPQQPDMASEKQPHMRKQIQPRKIEKEKFTLAALRDKYMNRLMEQGISCRLCKQENMFVAYHSTASLILHKSWRHRAQQFKCDKCTMWFAKQYKLKIHARRCQRFNQ